MADTIPRPLARQRNVLLAVLLTVAAAAWVLVVWEARSPMDGMPAGLGLTMGMAAPVFVGMWAAMMAGMMFPAAAPMILMYATMQGRKREGSASLRVAVFVSAYMVVWTAFGVVAFGLAAGTDAAADRSAWLATQWPRVAGALLIAAGLYQLSPLKDVCLSNCRTPFSFVISHWRDGTSGAFRMGLRHGVYCLGCCWMLFVVLVPLGVMNLAAMAAVAVLVFAEKTFPRGEVIARVGAVGLLGYGALVMAIPDVLPGTM